MRHEERTSMTDIRDLGLASIAAAGLLLAATTTARAGTTERVSVGPHGRQGDGTSDTPALAASGRVVAFSSDATDLGQGATDGWRDVFVRARQAGTTERVSVSASGKQRNADSGALGVALSAGGRFVAFDSYATNLVKGDTDGWTDVFVRTR